MLLLLIAFALIALIDLIPIIRDRSWVQLAAFLTLFVPALSIAFLLKFNVTVPSLMLLWGDLIRRIGLSY